MQLVLILSDQFSNGSLVQAITNAFITKQMENTKPDTANGATLEMAQSCCHIAHGKNPPSCVANF